MSTESFIRLRLTGGSFDEHVIPFEFLKRISSLEEMVIALARARYLEDHPGRRLPRGFTTGVGLSLATLEVGSAVAEIEIVNTRRASFEGRRYFNHGCTALTDLLSMEEYDEALPDETPRKIVTAFRRIGRGLQADDVIEITGKSLSSPVRLTKGSRLFQVDQLVGSSAPLAPERTRRLSVSGQVPTADRLTMTFRIQTADGRIAAAPLLSHYDQLVLEALVGYESGTRLQVDGIGQTNRGEPQFTFNFIDNIEIEGPRVANEDIDALTFVDGGEHERRGIFTPTETQSIIRDSSDGEIRGALNITSQLDELRSLEDGWLEGGGVAPSHGGLDWLIQSFERHYPSSLPRPYLYPTEEGGVQAEWVFGGIDIEVRIDLSTRRGAYLWLDESTEEERELDLADGADWGWLVSVVREHAEQQIE